MKIEAVLARDNVRARAFRCPLGRRMLASGAEQTVGHRATVFRRAISESGAWMGLAMAAMRTR